MSSPQTNPSLRISVMNIVTSLPRPSIINIPSSTFIRIVAPRNGRGVEPFAQLISHHQRQLNRLPDAYPGVVCSFQSVCQRQDAPETRRIVCYRRVAVRHRVSPACQCSSSRTATSRSSWNGRLVATYVPVDSRERERDA